MSLEEEQEDPELCLCPPGEDASQKVDVSRAGRVPSPGPEFSSTLTLDCPNSRAMRSRCLLLKPRSLWYFVMVAKADQYGKQPGMDVVLTDADRQAI